MKAAKRIEVRMGSNEDLAAALARRQAILRMNSITIVAAGRAERKRGTDPPPLLALALAVLAALAALGIIYFFSWWGWMR